MTGKKIGSALFTFYLLIASTGILAVLGLIMVFSASSIHAIDTRGSAFAIALRQFIFLLFGIPAAIWCARLSISRWQKIAKFGAVAAFVLVAVLLIPGIGKSVNGNTNWIDLKIFDVQPSEFAKLFLILWAAFMLAKKEEMKKYRFSVFGLLAPGFVLVILVILKEGDLGTAAVIAGILAGLLFISGIDLNFFGKIFAGGAVVLAGLIAMEPYRIRRFTSFLFPFAEENYKTISWQPAHSLLGLASGGLFGVGLGGSRQKWGNLPEAHTDFIFSIIGEELGLLGTLSVLALFIVLIYAIFAIGLRAADPFSRNVCIGIGSWIAVQSILNIGMAISVLPVIGIALPLVSYGGSALLALLLALGFVAGTALRDKEVSRALVAKFASK